jgi:hypothetical protein
VEPEKTMREAQASAEIGETIFSRGVPAFLVAVFIACLSSVWILQLISDWRRASDEQRDIDPLWSSCGVTRLFPSIEEIGYTLGGGEVPTSLGSLASVRGLNNASALGFVSRFQLVNARVLRSIDAFDSCIDEQSFLADSVVPKVRGVTTGLLSAGNENALLGNDGWLFFKPDVDHLLGRPFLDEAVLRARRLQGNEWTGAVEPDPVKAIVALRDQLGKRGIELIVMPTPVKPALYPDKFSSRYGERAGPLWNPSFNELKQRLDAAGVHLFDATQALSAARKREDTPLYLKTDTHWSPRGVRVVTEALSAFIRDKGLAPGPPADHAYVAQKKEVSTVGDIVRMLKIEERLSPFTEETTVIHQVLTKGGAPWQRDENAEVLLLGDSFTNIYSLAGMGWGEHAGFAEQLSAAMQAPLDVISRNDAGAFATREQLSKELARGRDRLKAKSLVIYQFAARELSFGDWRTGLDLTLKKRDNSKTTAAKRIQVQGTVATIVKSPSPGSVAYKDCYIPVHLTELRADGGAPDVDEAVVFLWGMLDSELTDYNRLEPGNRVTLSVVPFDTVADRVESYRHEELTDTRLLLLQTFWGDERMPGKGLAAVGARANETVESEEAEQRANRTIEDEPKNTRAFLDELQKIYDAAKRAGRQVIQGGDGWLFLPSEIRHLLVGTFWGPSAETVSRAVKPEHRDPLPAILDFKKQLDRAGVDLLVVPVPAKAMIYPDKLAPSVHVTAESGVPRLDFYHRRFIEVLRAKGVDLLDLTDLFLKERTRGALYCLQDSHWSGRAVMLAAQAIAKRFGKFKAEGSRSHHRFAIEEKDVQLTGDLLVKLGRTDVPKEIHRLYFVKDDKGDPVAPSRESPVLLLGDSHTLVFHAGGDMHAKGAGLLEHLTAALGSAVDLIGVRGSGATPSRVSLMRRGDNLQGKKIVIWVFSARELTESRTGWAKIPVVRSAD